MGKCYYFSLLLSKCLYERAVIKLHPPFLYLVTRVTGARFLKTALVILSMAKGLLSRLLVKLSLFIHLTCFRKLAPYY